MKFITVKSKQTTVSVDLVPPLVLGHKQRISLVDIRIPEQYFEFTNGQAIGTDSSDDDQLKIIHFSNKVKKTADGGARPEVAAELRRQIHAEMLKKLAFEEDHLK